MKDRKARLEMMRVDPEYRKAVLDDFDVCEARAKEWREKYKAVYSLFVRFVHDRMELLPTETAEQRIEYLLMLQEREKVNSESTPSL
jgi:hypothetical protein